MNKVTQLEKEQQKLLYEFYRRLAELRTGRYDSVIDKAMK